MSRRLVLIRHAKAEPAHPLGDHERELAEQGLADAGRLGAWLEQQNLGPDLALVSSAARAQATAKAALGPDHGVDVWKERRIYDGGAAGVIAAVSEAPEEAAVVWAVGHEPTMSETVRQLVDGAADGLADKLSEGFPTATAAVLEVHGDWAEVASAGCRLLALHTGRAEGDG